MPNINLRLTEEEHEALRTWAFDGRRSIQREIIYRLFSSEAAVGYAAVSGSAPLVQREEEKGSTEPVPPRPERAASDSHFRPDFKK